MSKGELMTVAYAEDLATRDDKIDSDEATHCARTLVAVYALLGAAARGELPFCDRCGYRVATRRPRYPENTAIENCEHCVEDYVAGGSDPDGWRDLPHAAALRAAMAKGGAT
jgi:hypothetical protein